MPTFFDRIKNLLTLPLGRKAFIGLATGFLAFVNDRYHLGISQETIAEIVGLAIMLMIGIALEDAAKSKGDGPKPPILPALFLLCLIPFAGCTWKGDAHKSFTDLERDLGTVRRGVQPKPGVDSSVLLLIDACQSHAAAGAKATE